MKRLYQKPEITSEQANPSETYLAGDSSSCAEEEKRKNQQRQEDKVTENLEILDELVNALQNEKNH